jgi:hypothetical protein
MKLKASKDKAVIKWFVVLSDGSKIRNAKGFINNAWDVKCSCGWETKTGGAIRSCIAEEVFNHKRFAHNYEMGA